MTSKVPVCKASWEVCRYKREERGRGEGRRERGGKEGGGAGISAEG